MTDSGPMSQREPSDAGIDWLAPVTSPGREALSEHALVERLRLTVLCAGYVVAGIPAFALALMTLLALPLSLVGIGLVVALLSVPATKALAEAHRGVTGALLDRRVSASYDEAPGGVLVPLRWARDRQHWRDLGFVLWSGTIGWLLALIPPALVAGPITYVIFLVIDPTRVWVLLFVFSFPLLVLWWVVTPELLRLRLRVEAHLLRGSEVARLRTRVQEVEDTRTGALDHSAAEIRRIERDLHDGAQARIAAVGMNVGLAEKLIASDPETAAALLREARESTVSALEDLRTVVRGILPPVLADRGLVGAIEALAVAMPMPVTVAIDTPRLPMPVETAVYFAVAECLANAVKHASATRVYVSGHHESGELLLTVGDDGRGGAVLGAGSGLRGIADRLAAFDGRLLVDSPAGGPTTITIEVPCPV